MLQSYYEIRSTCIIALYMLRFGSFCGKIDYSVKIFVETVGKDE